jgi:hypothetical protein
MLAKNGFRSSLIWSFPNRLQPFLIANIHILFGLLQAIIPGRTQAAVALLLKNLKLVYLIKFALYCCKQMVKTLGKI